MDNKFPTVSLTIVAASITVGIPMAMTGIPITFSSMPNRRFPTPAPGAMPVFVIWIVLFRRFTLRAARASMTSNTSGRVSRTVPSKISRVSIPVWAITPGAKALTQPIPRVISEFLPYSWIKWRVINRWSTTIGPRASGAISWFPIPATNTFLCFISGINRRICSATSFVISRW